MRHGSRVRGRTQQLTSPTSENTLMKDSGEHTPSAMADVNRNLRLISSQVSALTKRVSELYQEQGIFRNLMKTLHFKSKRQSSFNFNTCCL